LQTQMEEEIIGRRSKGVTRLEIEVTRRCQLRCIHCSVSASMDVASEELEVEEIKNIISEFGKFGKEVVITGGEPLVRGKDFILELIEEAECHGLRTFIYTSGCLVDSSFGRKLRNKSVTLCVSIEGTEFTHDSITGVRNSYKRAVNALRLCQSNNIPIVINFTPMHPNYRDFPHILKIARDFKAKCIKIFNFSAQGRGHDNRDDLKLSAREQQEVVKVIREVLDEKTVPIDFGGEILGLNTRCSVGNKIVITSEGDIVPCLGLRSNPNFVIGNCRNESLSGLVAKLEKMHSGRCLCASIRY
jgi:MoaA/NifB/PqqE/SkfB family radical SAM enzyme